MHTRSESALLDYTWVAAGWLAGELRVNLLLELSWTVQGYIPSLIPLSSDGKDDRRPTKVWHYKGQQEWQKWSSTAADRRYWHSSWDKIGDNKDSILLERLSIGERVVLALPITDGALTAFEIRLIQAKANHIIPKLQCLQYRKWQLRNKQLQDLIFEANNCTGNNLLHTIKGRLKK